MQPIHQVSYHVPGTLAADLAIKWTVPCDSQLIHVSAVNSSANAAGLEIGTSADADAYLTKKSIGVSGTPVEFDFNDFVQYADKAYPHIGDGTIVVLTLDHDYNGGGGAADSADFTIVLTFMEG